MWKEIKRYLFRKRLREFLKNIPSVSKQAIIDDEHAVMVVMREEDWKPEMNDYWELDANKTIKREGLFCLECKKSVVMSNGMYEAYSQNKHNPKLLCAQCVPVHMENNKPLVAQHRKLK